LYKNHQKLIPLQIIKKETDNFIYYEFVVSEMFDLTKVDTKICSTLDCKICYEIGKHYYNALPFICNHNDVCVDCINLIYKTSKKCPICRADIRSCLV
jgi:hypothetical protein